jgi:diguanylate cyclase (GGDEF)-like protein/PAS domain S-box-containing protein
MSLTAWPALHRRTLSTSPHKVRAGLWRAVGLISALAYSDFLVVSFAATAPPIRFTRFSVEQGLSQATVQAILQDHLGFLWFGTEEGLNRFDGYTFEVFRHDPANPRSLADDMVSVLLEDRQRRLWVGSETGLSLFDRRTDTFDPVPGMRGRVTGLVEEPDGTLWAAVDGQGLFERDPHSDAFRLHQPQAGSPTSLGSYRLSALLRDRSGQIWIGTWDAGVDRLERQPGEPQVRFVHHRHDPREPGSLVQDEVFWGGLAEDTAGRLWVATYGGGLSLLDRATGVFRQYRHRSGDPHSIGTDLLTCLFVDRAGTLWIGTDGAGVQRYDAATDSFQALVHDPADPVSLSQNVVRSIYQDVQGQLWVGTYLGGANLLRPPHGTFGYLTHSPTDLTSLSDPAAASFLEDRNGRIWVGTEGGWLNQLEPETGFVRVRFPSPAPSGPAILSLHEDREGRIWAGTYRSGLGRFDLRSRAFIIYRHQDGDSRSLGNNEVWSIAEDEEGALWLATNRGIDRFDRDHGIVTAHIDAVHPLGQGTIGARALLRDREGNLWVGTLGGLGLLRRGSRDLVYYRHRAGDANSLSDDRVVALCEDRRGRLWVGTLGGGLNRLNRSAGTFTSYERFPSNVIQSIQEDASGSLWLGTNHGLSRFDPDHGTIRNFDLSNGLQSLQFALGASLRTRSGRLLFGSTDGFYDFDPTGIRPDTYAPRVVFTSVRVQNDPAKLPSALSTVDELTFTHRDRVLSFEFAALDYTFPRHSRYAYLMEGFTDRWMELGEKREVTFTNLDPGTYVVRVKASNSDGVWSDASRAALRVVITPPFWATWWFRGALSAALGLGLFAVHRVRVRHLTADLAERARAEEALRHAEEQYRTIFEHSVEGIFQTTPSGRFLVANPAMSRMLGYPSPVDLVDQAVNIDRDLYVDPVRRAEFRSLLDQQGSVHGFEAEVYRKDGERIWVSTSARVVRDAAGAPLYYEGTAEDVTERKRAEETVEYLAYHDALTGLPNRLLLKDRLDQARIRAHRHRHHLAVAFLDIDDFKLVNDTLGHSVGDRLLQQVGERLLAHVRGDDTVSRVGGDEFILLFAELERDDDAARAAEKVLHIFRLPFTVEGHELFVTASVGLALYPSDGENPETLLRNADAAMYRAKESGRNTYQLCSPGMNTRALERMTLERGLRHAVDRDELVLHYQPIVSLGTGRIVGIEALLRWQHPERGLVYPETFIAIAEESRLIVPIGEWILQTACAQLREWRRNGHGQLRMSVNLSVHQIHAKGLARTVEAALDRAGIPADCLELEITESVAMRNVELTKSVLRALRDMGVSLSIDDFGTGESSLSHLRHFPLSALKIDRSFVRDIAIDPDNEAIVQAVTALAHILKLQVIAEGVETAEQVDFLRQAGCEAAQGHLFSRPVPAAILEDLLEADRARIWPT